MLRELHACFNHYTDILIYFHVIGLLRGFTLTLLIIHDTT